MRYGARPSDAAVVPLFLSLLLAAGTARGQVSQERALPSFRAQTAELARDGAVLRLRSPECQQILTDFEDDEGRPLAQNLEILGFLPADYLARIPLLDGTNHALCQAGRSQLLTTRGVSRIFVCRAFLRTVARERAQAEVYLIHEMLHTLGLGENPPSSQEITQQVKRRCSP